MIPLLEKTPQKCFHYLLNLIYPLNCLICQKQIPFTPPRGLCPECFTRIQRNFSPPGSWVTSESKYYFKQIWVAAPYRGIMKECIQLLKYKRKLILLEQLSRIMIEFAQKNIPRANIDGLVAVPLHYARLKEREFNQSQLLASRLARHFNLPLLNNTLKRTRPTPSQANLSKQERFASLKDAFALKEKEEIKRKNILLVDDVFTTGATVNECAQVLIKSSAKEVSVFTLAGG